MEEYKTSKLTPKQFSGLQLEETILTFLNKIGLKSQHNDFSNYTVPNVEQAVDFVIPDIALIECTNPKETTPMNDEIMNNKIDYFHRRDPEHKFPLWFLTISFLTFSKAIAERLLREGIIPIVLGETANEFNHHKLVRRLLNTDLFKMLSPFTRYRTGKYNPKPNKKLKRIEVNNSEPILSSSPLPTKHFMVGRKGTLSNFIYSFNKVGKDSNYLHEHLRESDNTHVLSWIAYLSSLGNVDLDKRKGGTV